MKHGVGMMDYNEIFILHWNIENFFNLKQNRFHVVFNHRHFIRAQKFTFTNNVRHVYIVISMMKFAEKNQSVDTFKLPYN